MTGIHHVTAIAGDPRRTLDFYARKLGLRLVKRTVNFDDPGTYHLYFGDEAGTPGSILTYFAWPGAAAGRVGAGVVDEIGLRVPLAAIDFWAARLGAEPTTRFGAPTLRVQDPDGLRLALTGIDGLQAEPGWAGDDVPPEHAIRGIGGVQLSLNDIAATSTVLLGVFGFVMDGQEEGCTRFRVPGLGAGAVVELREAGNAGPARQGRGSVHHLAFRAADDAEQAALVAKLARDHGLPATEQKDRDYFRSVYLRSPGGVLFEIATDAPGFAVDEDPAALGTALKLPRFLRGREATIAAALPALD